MTSYQDEERAGLLPAPASTPTTHYASSPYYEDLMDDEDINQHFNDNDHQAAGHSFSQHNNYTNNHTQNEMNGIENSIRKKKDPPNFNRIQKRRHSFSKSDKNNDPNDNSSTISFDLYPDDESSTFILNKERLKWCGSKLYLYIRQVLFLCFVRIKNKTNSTVSKMDGMKVILVGLFLLACIFGEFGTSTLAEGSNRNDHFNSMQLNNANGIVGNTDNSLVEYNTHPAGASIKGYQARSQVPIPIEYANFVELAEFVDAVTVVRVLLEMMQQQQQPHGRRLGDGKKKAKANKTKKQKQTNNNKENDEVNAMNSAIDKSWEQTIQDNPELQQQQQEQEEEEQQSNMLKVQHVPFFWHIPRSGGTTLSTLLATCHLLVQATSSFTSPPVYTRGEDEALASRFRDPTLYVVRTKRQQFVNVDLDSLEGVQRAVNGNLIEKELADVVAVPDVRLGSLLFGNGQNQFNNVQNQGGEGNNVQSTKKEYKGVLFALFRHPIERSVSWFYYKQSVKDSIHYDPSLEIYSIQDWVNSPSYITDYMVRTLVGKIDSWAANPEEGAPFRPPVRLSHEDLDVAKEILRRKCVIGLLDEKGESMKRFEKFFGWNADVSRDSLFLFEDEDTAHAVQAEKWKNVKDEECRDRLLHWNWANKNKHPQLEEGTTTYNLLESKNRYDIELYMYARQLFEEQFVQLGFDDDAIDVGGM